MSSSSNRNQNDYNSFQLTLHLIQNRDDSKNFIHHHQNTCLFNTNGKKHLIQSFPDIAESTYLDSDQDKSKSKDSYLSTHIHHTNNHENENEADFMVANLNSQIHRSNSVNPITIQNSNEHSIASIRTQSQLNKEVMRLYLEHLKVPISCFPKIYEGYDVNFLHYGSKSTRQFRDVFMNKMGKEKLPFHDNINDFLNFNIGSESSIFHLTVKDLFEYFDEVRKTVPNKIVTLHLEILLLHDDKWIDLLNPNDESIKLRIINNGNIQLENTTKIEVTSIKSFYRVLQRSLSVPGMDIRMSEGAFILRIHYTSKEISFLDGNMVQFPLEEVEQCLNATTVLEDWIKEIERFGTHWISRKKDQARMSHKKDDNYDMYDWESEEDSSMTLSESTISSTITFLDLPFSQNANEKSFRKDWVAQQQIQNQKNQQKLNIASNARSNAIISFQQIVKAINQKSKFIPYRDSQLSRFLIPVIGGSSITKLICSILDRNDCLQDAYNSLMFSQQAKSITNKLSSKRIKIKKEKEIDIIVNILNQFIEHKNSIEDSLFELSYYSPIKESIEIANKIHQLSPILKEQRQSPLRIRDSLGSQSARFSSSQKKLETSMKPQSARGISSSNNNNNESIESKPIKARNIKIVKKSLENKSNQNNILLDNSVINSERPFIKTLYKNPQTTTQTTNSEEHTIPLHDEKFRKSNDKNSDSKFDNGTLSPRQKSNLIGNLQDSKPSIIANNIENLMKENTALQSQVRFLSEEQIVLQAKLRAQNNLIATYQIKNRDLQIELDRKNEAINQLQEKVDMIQGLQQKLLSTISYQEEFNVLKQQNELLKDEIDALGSRLLAQESKNETSAHLNQNKNNKSSLISVNQKKKQTQHWKI